MTATFEPLARKTLSNEVRDLLLQSIRVGRFPPGSALPSERTLCTELGVARTSVREAIQGLMSTGVIERRGNRACVAEDLPELGFDHSKRRRLQMVRQLFEVRRIIEVPTVRLAAERATHEQRAEIAAIAARANPTMPLPEFRLLDRQFHALVARAANNPVLAEVELKVLESLLPSGDLPAAEDSTIAIDERIVRESSVAHNRIARAISAGDSDAAAEASARHLDQVEDWLLRTV